MQVSCIRQVGHERVILKVVLFLQQNCLVALYLQNTAQKAIFTKMQYSLSSSRMSTHYLLCLFQFPLSDIYSGIFYVCKAIDIHEWQNLCVYKFLHKMVHHLHITNTCSATGFKSSQRYLQFIKMQMLCEQL